MRAFAQLKCRRESKCVIQGFDLLNLKLIANYELMSAKLIIIVVILHQLGQT